MGIRKKEFEDDVINELLKYSLLAICNLSLFAC
jgi:hypothetical protein